MRWLWCGAMTRPSAFKFKVMGAAGDRRFHDITDAERYARAHCARSGHDCQIQSLQDGSNGALVADIRRDNAGRVWTDVNQYEGSMI